MKIAIIGTGAMGSIYAARFATAGYEVIAVDICLLYTSDAADE